MANEIAIYHDPNGVTRVELPAPLALRMQTLKEFQITKQEMENEEKEVKEIIAEAMDKFGVSSFEIDGITFTRKAPHTRTTIDTKRLKAERPEVAEEYSKTTTVAGSLVVDYGD